MAEIQIRKGIDAEPGDASASRIEKYDFKRPDKFSKDQIVSMQLMHETFARLSTTTLSAALRTLAHVHVSCVDQLNYEEFIRSIPLPTTLAVVDMDPLKGQAILEIDPAVTFAIIDRLFGGSGEDAGLSRELTDIEHSIMEGIAVRLLGNFRESWSQVIDLRPRLTRIETNPQFAQIVPPSEMIVLVSLETRIGDVQGMIKLCFPYITIEPIVPKLSAQYWYSSMRGPSTREAVQAMLGHMEGIVVPAEVLVEGERLSLRDLGALRKGSLVRVPGYDLGEASFRMGGRILFSMKKETGRRGRPGAYRVTARPALESLPLVESPEKTGAGPEIETAVRKALEDFQTGIAASLSGIASGLSSLRQRQDELTDQLALGSSAVPESEAPMGIERKRPFDFIRRVDPAIVLNFIQQEHPQAIALVLSYLEPQSASAILGNLPLELQPDVVRRIACMERTMPEVVREVERILDKKLSSLSSEEYTAAGGVESIVDILNMADRSTERHVVESLERDDPALAEQIKKRMFVFEDIVLLDRKAVEKLAKRLDAEVLVRAMKAAPEEVKSFIWACLPKTDEDRLKALLEEIGRVRLSEVDAAQQKVVALIREMEENGEILLAHPNETVE